jgi:hypothetical protein
MPPDLFKRVTAIFAVSSAGPSNGAMKPVAAIAAPIKIGLAHAALADVAFVAEIPVAASAAAATPTKNFFEIFMHFLLKVFLDC